MPLCAHRRLSLSLDKDGPASPQAIMYPQKGFWQKKKKHKKNVPHFTPTSTAAFNMWNTSSTNPELVLSRFLRSPCNLSQLGLYTGAWIYPIRHTCTPTCTHTHRPEIYCVAQVQDLGFFCYIRTIAVMQWRTVCYTLCTYTFICAGCNCRCRCFFVFRRENHWSFAADHSGLGSEPACSAQCRPLWRHASASAAATSTKTKQVKRS